MHSPPGYSYLYPCCIYSDYHILTSIREITRDIAMSTRITERNQLSIVINSTNCAYSIYLITHIIRMTRDNIMTAIIHYMIHLDIGPSMGIRRTSIDSI